MARFTRDSPTPLFEYLVTFAVFAFGVWCVGRGTWALVNGAAPGLVLIVMGVVGVGVGVTRYVLLSPNRTGR